MNANLSTSMQDRGNPSDRSTEFQPVEGGGPATTDAGTFMVAAYALMWLATVLFIVQTWRKIRSVQGKVDQLQKAVADRPDAGG